MADIPTAAAAGTPARSAGCGDRVLRWPLAAFLGGVVVIAAYGAFQRFRTPSVEEAVRWLADGDLDAAERRRPLAALVAAAVPAAAPEVRLAGLMASISIGDRDSYAVILTSLGGGAVPSQLPPEPARELLHLGDPMLGNCLLAFAAEVRGDTAAAASRWRQVQAQAGLADHAFGRELAESGLQRNR